MRDRLEALLRIGRSVSGMPDYQAYVEHLRAVIPASHSRPSASSTSPT